METQNLSRWKLITVPDSTTLRASISRAMHSRTGQLLTTGAVVAGATLLVSSGVSADSYYDLSGSTLIADAQTLFKEAAKIALGIGMAAVAFYIGLAALRWLRGAA